MEITLSENFSAKNKIYRINTSNVCKWSDFCGNLTDNESAGS